MAVLTGGASPASAAQPAKVATVAGHMYGLDGRAVAAGCLVNLVAWPRNEDLAKLRESDKVPTRTIATVTTNESGRFILRYAQTDALRAFATSDATGMANLSLESTAGGVAYSYSLSRPIGAGSTTAAQAVAGGTSAAETFDLHPNAGTTKASPALLKAASSSAGLCLTGRSRAAG